jgi:hypothetical protein
MVNRALEKMVIDDFGEDTWSNIKSRADIDIATFASFTTYDDGVTVGLAVAASEELERPLDELLRRFGQYWIEFALESSYAPILRQSGDNLHELLPMLDAMHTRLALSFPELNPPTFEVLSDDGHLIILRYGSSRRGLAPFVVGLLKGLGRMFDTPVEVSHDEPADDGHIIFEIRCGAMAD